MENNNYLYGLTVQGIQSYIFSTNKLKEIIGASEIIEQMCTTWFFKFLEREEGKKLEGIEYLNAAGNIRFKGDKETVETIFKEYHHELLKKAPGVPFSQAIVSLKNKSPKDAIKELDKKLNAQRNQPMQAFDMGLMTRSNARRTGEATYSNLKDADNKLADIITGTKLLNNKASALVEKTQYDKQKATYPKEFKEIAKDAKHSWLAVVHIDGNGMGNTINKLLGNEENKKGENVFEVLQDFSIKVGESTVNAYDAAMNYVFTEDLLIENNSIVPIRPIILGGDDLTVIIRADLALKFTKVFLQKFEEETKLKGIKNGEGLTSCAGITYVKEKFPFHYSVNLAEDLCSFAKDESERKASCLQFHRIQDSFINTYDEIKERELTTFENEKFINGPYYLYTHNNDSTIDEIIRDVERLKEEDAPTNGMRQWLDLKFNNPILADTLKTRLKTKGYDRIINKEKAYIDYFTLLAVNNQKI